VLLLAKLTKQTQRQTVGATKQASQKRKMRSDGQEQNGKHIRKRNWSGIYWLTLKVRVQDVLRNETGQFVALADPTEVDWSGEGSERLYWSFRIACRGRVVIMVDVSGPRFKRTPEYCVGFIQKHALSWHAHGAQTFPCQGP